jgi:hypothetical protein
MKRLRDVVIIGLMWALLPMTHSAFSARRQESKPPPPPPQPSPQSQQDKKDQEEQDKDKPLANEHDPNADPEAEMIERAVIEQRRADHRQDLLLRGGRAQNAFHTLLTRVYVMARDFKKYKLEKLLITGSYVFVRLPKRGFSVLVFALQTHYGTFRPTSRQTAPALMVRANRMVMGD